MKKGARLLLILLLVAAGGAIAYMGVAPEGYRTIADVMRDPAAHTGRPMELKATVEEGSVILENGGVTFAVTDGAWALPVRWDPAIPLPQHEAGGTLDGRSVVVRGTLVAEEGGLVFLASGMQVGCASKYEAA